MYMIPRLCLSSSRKLGPFFRKNLGQKWTLKFHKVKLLKFNTFNFNLKHVWNWSFFHYEKVVRFKSCLQLTVAQRTRAWHHHGSTTSTSPRACIFRVRKATFKVYVSCWTYLVFFKQVFPSPKMWPFPDNWVER